MIQTFFRLTMLPMTNARSKLIKSQWNRLFFCKNLQLQSHSLDRLPEFAFWYAKQPHMLLWQIQIPLSGTNQNAELSVPISASFKIISLRDVACADEPHACPRFNATEPLKKEKRRVALECNVLNCLCIATPAGMPLAF